MRTPYSVSVQATGPIVAGRSVTAASGARSPVWGSTSGSTTIADQWLLPGPGVPGAPGIAGAILRSIAVADPGSSPAQVVIDALSGATVASFTVSPGKLMVLGPTAVGGLRVFTVTASQPVSVEADNGPTGAPGIVPFSGFPFSSDSGGG